MPQGAPEIAEGDILEVRFLQFVPEGQWCRGVSGGQSHLFPVPPCERLKPCRSSGGTTRTPHVLHI